MIVKVVYVMMVVMSLGFRLNKVSLEMKVSRKMIGKLMSVMYVLF